MELNLDTNVRFLIRVSRSDYERKREIYYNFLLYRNLKCQEFISCKLD